MHDAVGIDIEGHFDLRDTSRRRRQVNQLKLTQCLVELSHLALALEYMDFNRWLTVVGGGEDLGTFSRDRGVSFDQGGHDTTLGLNAK